MMKLVLICFLPLAVMLAACSPYPRYRADGNTVPEERGPEASNALSTDEYIRLGMIMQEYLGLPYGAGSNLSTPIDCSLFAQEVFRRFARIPLPRTAADQFRYGERIPSSMARYGDLVFFRTDGSKISHVGIFIGNNEFMHTSSSHGVIISSLGEEYWARRFAGARRVLTLADTEN